MNRPDKGLSLLEVLVSIAILALAIGALATIYPGIFTGVNQDMQSLKSWEFCQRHMETLKNSSFTDLTKSGVYYIPGETDPITNKITGDGNMSAVYYVAKMRDKNNVLLNDIVTLEVAVCYKVGNNVTGEDSNLNGVLDGGEDTNGDGKINSPACLTTLVLEH
jgi:prepilin-type N-terminal cleavage/methylation domain-containing protein